MSRRVIAGGLIVAVGVSLLMSWPAQKFGDDEIHWEVGALTFTGFATLGLALATFGLATQTRRDVDSSTKAANAAVRPILAASPVDRPTTQPHGESGTSGVETAVRSGEVLARDEAIELALSIAPDQLRQATELPRGPVFRNIA